MTRLLIDGTPVGDYPNADSATGAASALFHLDRSETSALRRGELVRNLRLHEPVAERDRLIAAGIIVPA